MQIRNKILKVEPLNWRAFKFIQTDRFKHFPEELATRLRESMVRNNFIETFKVWQDKKDIYCLDGFHRCMILRELEGQGYEIPEKLPCEFIECKDKSEAAKLVLVYSSSYATINKDVLQEFVENFDLNIDALGDELNLQFGLTHDLEDEDSPAGESQAEYPIVPKFSERYDYVVIFCKNEIDFTNLCEQMKLRQEKNYKNSNVGMGRVITYEKFMERWNSRS